MAGASVERSAEGLGGRARCRVRCGIQRLLWRVDLVQSARQTVVLQRSLYASGAFSCSRSFGSPFLRFALLLLARRCRSGPVPRIARPWSASQRGRGGAIGRRARLFERSWLLLHGNFLLLHFHFAGGKACLVHARLRLSAASGIVVRRRICRRHGVGRRRQWADDLAGGCVCQSRSPAATICPVASVGFLLPQVPSGSAVRGAWPKRTFSRLAFLRLAVLIQFLRLQGRER